MWADSEVTRDKNKIFKNFTKKKIELASHWSVLGEKKHSQWDTSEAKPSLSHLAPDGWLLAHAYIRLWLQTFSITGHTRTVASEEFVRGDTWDRMPAEHVWDL